MPLSLELISQFAKLSAGNKETSKESTVYATVYNVGNNGEVDICIDGSVTGDKEIQDQISPAICTSEVKKGDRVTVLIKNHSAIVTGNIDSPSASTGTVSGISNNIVDILGSDLSGATEGFIFDINGRVTNLDNGLSGASGGLDYLVEEVDRIKSKGRNLYLGTRNFDGDKWNNLEQWQTWDKGTFKFKEYGRWGAWQGIFQSVMVEANETYTFSFYAKGDSNAVMNVYLDWDKEVSNPYSIELGAPASNSEYTRYSFTFVSLVDDYIYPRVENATEESWLQVCGLKFEKGELTDWSPAPEDIGQDVDTASKTATNYLGLSSIGLVVGDMTANSLGKNVLIAADEVAIRNGDDVLASFTENGISFDKQATFTSDEGLLMDNGDAYAYVGRNDILWSGAYYMHAGQTINFKTNLSRQLTGAVFAWSYYDGTNAQDQNWAYFFVPKTHVIKHGGSGVSMDDPYLGLMKYLYISNSGATGHNDNTSEGTSNGIAWNNRKYVLRYVIGV